ncbi:MAG: methionyl-tRNA formyltransferase [Planctomycetota bacterium]
MRARVLFAGSPEVAVPALRAVADAHDVVHVLTQPPRPRGRRGTPQPTPVAACAAELGLTCSAPDDLAAPGVLEAITAESPQVGVVVAYGRILTARWLEALPLGWLNLHFSLLPRWRGAAPVAAAIAHGDGETGVSIIQLVRALDAGPIHLVERTPIGEAETTGELEMRLAHIGAPMLTQVIGSLLDGTAAPVPQEEAQATYAGQFAKAAGRVDWGRSAGELAHHVRAMQPWPGAITELHAAARRQPQRVALLEVAPAAGGEHTGDPGTILDAARGVVACGEGALVIARLQPSGKTPMAWADFCNGYRVADGDHFA